MFQNVIEVTISSKAVLFLTPVFLCLQTVADMITRMRREIGDGQFRSEPCFDSMLLLDRTCDLLTPLPTQLTYEGLIDEFFDLQNGEKIYCFLNY